MPVNERQVGGDHYKKAEYQHWDWAVDNFGPEYLAAAVTKYVVRWRTKDGLKDLRKAQHYLEKLLEKHAQEAYPYPPPRLALEIDRLTVVYALTAKELSICSAMATYRRREDLETALTLLKELIEEGL